MPEESTTPDLVERTRRMLEAMNGAHFNEVISNFSPNAVWDATEVGLFVYEGYAAIREFLAEWQGLLDGIHTRLEEVTDLGEGIMFGIVSTTGRLRGSSGELQLRWAAVSQWTESLITRVAVHSDIDVARAAAERLAESRGRR